MSDKDLTHCLDDLQLLLQAAEPEADALALWQEHFDAAVASAERGPEWPAIVQRAHALAARADIAVSTLSAKQNLIREEMNVHRRGARALKAYKPN